ncbi:MAG TPA: adenylate kinase [Longimicrobiales bacterium]|nr:adenylate kinase [Longimicrobiales bacterium]
MNLVLFGPPGAGKGTQGTVLAETRGLMKISTGDILRDAVRAGTTLGLEAKKFMDAGELVPDSVILGLVREAIQDAGSGFIMDGFPRTMAQAEGVDAMLTEMQKGVDAVIILDVPDEALVQRLSGRRSCPNCGAVYNVYFDKPKHDEKCDRCQSELVQRADDKRDTVVRRLDVYKQQTAPIIEYYQKRGANVQFVDGDRDIDAVQRDILRILDR